MNVQQPQTTAQEAALEEFSTTVPIGPAVVQRDLSLIDGVKVTVEAFAGTATLSVGELFALRRDAVVQLDQAVDALFELRLGDKRVAVGRLVVVDDNLGIAITEVCGMGQVKAG